MAQGEDKIKKTGLAARIRAALKPRERACSRGMLCMMLGMERGEARQSVNSALQDFFERDEIRLTPKGFLKYNHAWRRADKSPLKDKILKAMYVQAGWFATTDIRKLVSDAEKSHVEKTIRRLWKGGRLQRVDRRICAHGAGAEWLYNITDRVKFRCEIMK